MNRFVIIAICGFLGLPGWAQSAETVLHKPISVDYHRVTLDDVLKDIAGKAGLRIDLHDKPRDGGEAVTYTATNQEAGRVLWRILKPRGLRPVLLQPDVVTLAAIADSDEFKVKREELFEFAQRPKVVAAGDRVTITFETRGFCDVTVAVEDQAGKIVRHLASGVLGENAPDPFQWNSRSQSIVWDGKNDKGEYVDKDPLIVRVSLGLQPRYEKNLYWEPKKRVAAGGHSGDYTDDVLMAAAPEGVYVFDGNGTDHVRLFDHDGNYVRTVYPFPADQIKAVGGLAWRDYPQGYARPIKLDPGQATFLSGGEPILLPLRRGAAAHALAVSGQRLALVKLCLSRLATDGSSGGLGLHGPPTSMPAERRGGKAPITDVRCVPYSAAFSPDGKRLYLAGYRCWTLSGYYWRRVWLSGVACMEYDGNAAPRPFAGELKADEGLTPGVACDSKGNVLMTDYAGDRILVYDPEGKLLKAIPVKKPTLAAVHPKTGEIYVISAVLDAGFQVDAQGQPLKDATWPQDRFPKTFAPTLTVLGPMDDPKVRATYDLPSAAHTFNTWSHNSPDLRAAVDFWTDPPTIWLAPPGPGNAVGEGNPGHTSEDRWAKWGIILLQPRDGRLVVRRDFGKDTLASVGRAWGGGGSLGNQFLYVNPATGKLWVAEKDVGGRACSRFRELMVINPADGQCRAVTMPRGEAEDMAFDIDGLIYLRYKQGLYDDQLLVRYEPTTWREVPWDYGEERPNVQSALMLPCSGTVCDDESGLWVAPNGNVLVACSNRGVNKDVVQTHSKPGEDGTLYGYRAQAFAKIAAGHKRYVPPIFPGRVNMSITPCLHIWDRHGRPVQMDAAPGMPQAEGVAMDSAGNLYMMADPTRILDGKKYFNAYTGTLVKVPAGRNKWVTEGGRPPVPLPDDLRPRRAADLFNVFHPQLWVEGAEWFYGGVGTAAFNQSGCHCWNRTRFALDYFARSFAPEVDQFSVAVLDSSGNLILRMGRYGNVDDGRPLDPKGAPPRTRPLGGDEIALMHPLFVAAHTDRRVFIADPGNARIVSVKLGYHATELVALK